MTSDGGWLNARVLRCSESNPCRGISFDNVTVTGWASSFYVCENTEGMIVNSEPKPSCVKSSDIDIACVCFISRSSLLLLYVILLQSSRHLTQTII